MDTTTPRQARVRLNEMERYFRRHLERYTPEDRLTLRALFEAAHTPQHADALAEALRAWRRPPSPSSARTSARTAGAASDGPRQPAAPAQPSSR